ncbi:MAG: hypothetical protein DU429_07350 [Candidatus Tokpelaia sp.]|nr:MAG: hypothetical protein DU429_07350 [Candidatus Tokpelaia sp.]
MQAPASAHSKKLLTTSQYKYLLTLLFKQTDKALFYFGYCCGYCAFAFGQTAVLADFSAQATGDRRQATGRLSQFGYE